MSKFVFSKKPESELPPIITPDLAKIRIRISTEGYPETGSMYFEGAVRTFVIERMPQDALIDLLPQLLAQPRFVYRPGTESLLVERIDG